MSTNSSEKGFENPFSQLGLNKEAIEALVSLNDPDALITAARGVQRALARALHPDVLLGKETPNSSAFLNGVVESTATLTSTEKPTLMILAKDYIRTSKKTPRKNSKPATSEEERSDCLPIIHDLAHTAIDHVGVCLPQNMRIIVNRNNNRISATPWLIYQRKDESSYTITPYALKPILDSQKDVSPAFVRLADTVLSHIPWERLPVNEHTSWQTNGRQKVKQHHALLNADLEVGQTGQLSLRNHSGDLVDFDLSQLEVEENLLSNPGIYRLTALLTDSPESSGQLQIAEKTLLKNYFTPVNETVTREMKIIGSADNKIIPAYTQAILKYNGGMSSEARYRSAISGMNGSAIYLMGRDHLLPANIHKKLGQYFLPSIATDRHVISSADDNFYLSGKILAIYPGFSQKP